ncbi:alpha/beta hydrolase [Corynebacterium cystitidis]|uniref:alpha/beta hydrolase n=1 Tax=Corynebacterium cystitidis TaxID=35757 RepID=UPI00211DB379|nr:alpha/beta hydrolase family protein [Corynebacterium cystitidis]
MKSLFTVSCVGLTALALTLAAVSPAHAQSSSQSSSLSSQPSLSTIGSSLSSEGGSSQAFREAIANSSQRPGSSLAALQATLSSVGLAGSSALEVPESFVTPPEGWPYPVDDTITEVELLNREISPQSSSAERRRIERWTVASPSMGRTMLVDVRPAANPTGPIVVMLDGVEAPIRSGWLYGPGEEEIDETFGDENVTLVFPLDANGTWYVDWAEDDPVLGRQQWETFIMAELLPLVEAQPDIYFNGKRAIGGLSMGATAAVHLAATYPELFDATFGISGCYSTLDPIGYQITSTVVESRGGTVENMYGPYGSKRWHRHNTVAHPEGLATMPVYLSAADGGISPVPSEQDTSTEDLAIGYILENGVLECTRDLDKSMRAKGMNHHKVHYKGDGRHNWRNFEQELEPAWDHIRPALF